MRRNECESSGGIESCRWCGLHFCTQAEVAVREPCRRGQHGRTMNHRVVNKACKCRLFCATSLRAIRNIFSGGGRTTTRGDKRNGVIVQSVNPRTSVGISGEALHLSGGKKRGAKGTKTTRGKHRFLEIGEGSTNKQRPRWLRRAKSGLVQEQNDLNLKPPIAEMWGKTWVCHLKMEGIRVPWDGYKRTTGSP